MEPRAAHDAFDAVIIGAGVIGASCAVHLARAGLRVAVTDRGEAPGAARSLDVHALRPSRFAEGDPVRGSALL